MIIIKELNTHTLVFFIESFSGGGAERVLLTILRNIDREKFDISVLVMNDGGVYSDAFHALGVEIIPILNSKISILNNIKYKLIYNLLPVKIAARWILRGIEADTYVAFIEGYCTKIFSAISNNKRKIAWVHCDLQQLPWTIEKGIFRNVEKERDAYHKYDIVIGVSESVTEMLKTRYGLNKVRTIYNPIDEKRIQQLASELCSIATDKSKFNIVSVGRLTAAKGYDKLIALMPTIVAANPDVRLYIVGEGEERMSLETQIRELGLGTHVILTGFLENPYSLMRQMDLFVCSSVAEGFSLVIAEAMIVGLPVVSMECAGPCELLGNGEYGILCSTYEQLKDTIILLSKDRETLAELKTKAIERSKIFDTKTIVKNIESILC